MDEVTIRCAVMADLEAVVALLEDADDLHRSALPWLLRRVDGPPLTDFLEAYVSKHDHAMFLAVYEFNEPARAFWASIGFQTLSRRLVLHSNPNS